MRKVTAPYAVVEVLRLLVVVFFAGVGFEISRGVSNGNAGVLGPFDGAAVGAIVGCGVGYVLGGVVARTTVTVVDRTEAALRSVSAESLVAGGIGMVSGLFLGAAIASPLFLIPQWFISAPLFIFVVVVFGLLGFRLGAVRRDGMLGIFGARAGLGPRDIATSQLPRFVDTSVAIDGRILDVVRAGFLHGTMLLAAPVLGELQALADAGDDLRRSRGRRGLETLEALRREPGVEIVVVDEQVPQVPEVDAKLVRLCLDREAALLTLDTNLARAAALAGVRVLNLHALTLSLRPPVNAGDEVNVLLIKHGKEPGQAVGYLDDGTMVVVEHGRDQLGAEVPVRVTSVLTTANGRMVFAQVAHVAHPSGPVAAASASSERRPRTPRP
ncbi:MAG: TRAM domain-containing protein [Terracoccus sp.]